MATTISDLNIRRLVPQDASNLVALFKSCYGDTYGNSSFYDVEGLAETIESEKLRSVVADDGSSLLGHMGITIRHAEAIVCETGNTVVHPSARGKGVMKQLAEGLRDLVVHEGFVGYIHFPTTAHDIMQRSSVSRGGLETGIMLAYVGAETDYEAIEREDGRLAATVVYQPLLPIPERYLYYPAHYRELLHTIYESLGIQRLDLSTSDEVPPHAPHGHVTAEHNPQRASLHLFLHNAGDDLANLVRAQIEKYRPEVTYIDLPLDEPRIDITIEILKKEGFFYCALLPEFSHTDLLRMQFLQDATPADFEPNLANESGKKICASLREDAGI
jgi:GNAT superfamily N-acetyltransferase